MAVDITSARFLDGASTARAPIPKYLPSDDGKTIDGKIIVFLHPPPGEEQDDEVGSGQIADDGQHDSPAIASGRSPPAGSNEAGQVAAAQAAALTKASARGDPFAEDCESARRQKAAGQE